MNQEKLDKLIKVQMIYWLTAIAFATGLALFAKLIWTAKFPILICLPMFMVAFALGSIAAIRNELTPLVTGEPKDGAQ